MPRESRPWGLSQALARFGIALAAAWGFAEATLFFIVPDVIVGLVALYHPRKAAAVGLAAVAGACAGGTVLHLVSGGIGDDLRGVMDWVPAVEPEMLERARLDLLNRGGAAIVSGVTQGIPYKLYVTEWALQGWGLPSLILWTVPARALRIVSFGLVVALVAWWARRRIEKRPRAWLLAYLGGWVAFYLYFWLVWTPARYGSS